MARTRKADWIKLAKGEYIGGKDLSIKDIAIMFKKSPGYVRQVAMREGWTKEKEERWNKIEREVIEEAEGSVKDLIKRHSRMTKFLQVGGIKNLKLLLDEVEEKLKGQDEEGAREVLKKLIYNKFITAGTLVSMVSEGLKGERELYPKQMKIEGDVEMRFGEVSDELKEAAHNALIKRITSRPRANTKRS